ncbi:SchA/CurD-like domain-containing protein [Streptacidiphilus melanogenes]|uniref:SchA/CurD-like domain-containing protein n=1 Tax=Streptacidiphilus melanogenes TaxID=411235 RepID=UPI0005AB2EE2|nr:SchA/CurD-like domain-containing protein [Streptacidiphilus melanogenes]
MTTDYTHTSAAGTADQRLRVVLLLDVHEGQEQKFLAAYDQICHQVADVPGHISDQLCQSLGNSSQWLITSEWECAEPFLSWVDSAAHRALVQPLHDCVADTRSLRFVIARQTPETALTPETAQIPETGQAVEAAQSTKAAQAPKPARPAQRPLRTDPLPRPPLASGGLVRHAIAFTVKPGSEKQVERILAGYASPEARVDANTRLCRTSLFMRGNQVVRAVEVKGDLGNALRHVAEQPEVRQVEEAVNPYLEEARDLTDPTSARAFFARAALPAVHHAGGPQALAAAEVTRHAFLYPVRPGQAAAVARLLGEQDGEAAADATSPLVQSTMFVREGLFMRMVDLSRPYQDVPVQASGITPRVAQRLLPLLDTGDPAVAADESALVRFLTGCEMSLVTDRAAPAS